MPVVSKRKMYVDASLKEFLMEVNYSSKDKMFSAELPEKVAEKLMMSKKYVSADSEAKCVDIWEATIKEYNEAKKEVSTVILFKISLNGVIPPPDKTNIAEHDHNRELFKLYAKDIFGFKVRPLGMIIEWGVYEKEYYKEVKQYRRLVYPADFNHHDPTVRGIRGNGIEGLSPDKVGKSIKEIPHSDEREQWFTNLQLAFENLILKVKDKLASLTPEELMALVDSNGFKLLSN